MTDQERIDKLEDEVSELKAEVEDLKYTLSGLVDRVRDLESPYNNGYYT